MDGRTDALSAQKHNGVHHVGGGIKRRTVTTTGTLGTRRRLEDNSEHRRLEKFNTASERARETSME